MSEEVKTGGLDLDALRATVTRQGNHVRELKASGAAQETVTAAVEELKRLKVELAAAVAAEEAESGVQFDRAQFEDLMKRRMFYVPSFEIYGGVAGLYDLGPPGCSLKTNILDEWRRHFILEEDMLHIDCTNLTAEPVLKASGHVDKFADLMVKDVETGECYRADKLLEQHIDQLLTAPELTSERRRELEAIQLQADAFSEEQLHAQLQSFGIKAPATGNDLTAPFPFNLMFQTSIGPEGNTRGFLRPETAQGMFLNFKRLLDFNAGKMPFAAAQIGIGFRNEISPRGGLLRVREFPLAEIEHFCNPEDKQHPKFSSVAHLRLPLFSAENQLGSGKLLECTLGEAVAAGVVNNETLAYFVARTYLFMVRIGIKPDRLRFRQHLPTEMAHYASDCWDVEVHTSYGWVECVGIADRSAFDLMAHSRAAKVDMKAAVRYDTPREVELPKLTLDNKLIGKTFKKDQKEVKQMLEELSLEDALALESTLASAGEAQLGPNCTGAVFTITRPMVSVGTVRKMAHEGKFVPAVIEPAFGVGRILYAAMEHSFYVREGSEQRRVMGLPAVVAPIKCYVFPLRVEPVYDKPIGRIRAALTQLGISNRLDTSSVSIGRRYARTDEVGVPFAITLDPNTVTPSHFEFDTVTVRERDSMEQIRVPVEEVPSLLASLVSGSMQWSTARTHYPVALSSEAAAAVADAAGAGDTERPASASDVRLSQAVVVTGLDRRCGRFSRPAEAETL
eukprot:CAMPEP_0196775576 /NCGR_PEP_ID=MMETSP1104-20130614/4107_1 /TAXON_ID=33652 /ORGANISM="Cafeteria sp., Strain Caron Lab Isolate" /LENGTH=734 /DNA_ID=CAMNT_0042145745 /DNA_START=12 /DNA_END=2216 /DNA_ORIENTATION=-